MTDNPTARVLEIAQELQLAMQDVPLAATGAEIADALQVIALAAAEKVADRRHIARSLMTLAERYLAADREERGEPETSTGAAHRAFTAAVSILAQQGIDLGAIREMMLGYAATWIGNTDGPKGAEIIYRHADTIAGRSMETRH